MPIGSPSRFNHGVKREALVFPEGSQRSSGFRHQQEGMLERMNLRKLNLRALCLRSHLYIHDTPFDQGGSLIGIIELNDR